MGRGGEGRVGVKCKGRERERWGIEVEERDRKGEERKWKKMRRGGEGGEEVKSKGKEWER